MSCNQLSYFPDSFMTPLSSNDTRTYCLSDPPAAALNCRAVLNAASGGLGPLPSVTTLFTSPFNIVSTSVDTRNLGTSNNLLHLSGILYLPAGVSVTLSFQFRRVSCSGQSVAVGGTYTLIQSVVAPESRSIDFQLFDSNVQPGFYTYSAELSANSIVTGAPGCTVSNAVLSILAASDHR